ncbi:MAG TPA: PAS domain-containing protein, partial [Oscillospiraceae bacterium]|nr:PAS domain-containing protein [Oscillospiraceae bacterium]
MPISRMDESPRPNGQGLSGLPAEAPRFPLDLLSGAVVCTGAEPGYPLRFVNDAFLSLLGYTREAFWAATGGFYARCIHPDDLARVEEALRDARGKGGRCTVSYRALDRAGKPIWLRDSSRLVTDDAGESFLICLCTDITDILALQKELEDGRNVLSELTESLPCGICRTLDDADLTILYANEAYYQMFGYTPEEARAAGFLSGRFILSDDQLALIHAATRENIQNGRLYYEIELRHRDRGGRTLYTLAHCRYLPESGQINTALVDITARKSAEEQLRISEEQFRIAAEQSANLVLRYDIATGTAYQTPAAAAEFGLPAVTENIPESFLAAGDVDPESAPVYFGFFDSIRRGLPKGSCEVRLRRADGSSRWYHGEFTTIFHADGAPLQAIISFSDCTQQRERQLAYDKWQKTVSEMIATSTIYAEFNLTRDLCEREEGETAYLVPEQARRSLTEMTAYALGHFIYSEDATAYRNFFSRERLLTCFFSGFLSDRMDCRFVSGAAAPVWFHIEVQMAQYPYSTDVKAYILFRNIDEEKRRELRLKQLSTIDALTGALNRAAFIEQTQAILAQVPSDFHAFVMIDIDHFKQVNDRLGHANGDRALREVVRDLTTILRTGDLIGRIGGDEFMLCMRSIPCDDVVAKRAELIVHLMERQVADGVSISGSLGIAVYPQDGLSFETLYQNADKALYQAKEQGRDRYLFYHADMRDAYAAPAASPDGEADGGHLTPLLQQNAELLRYQNEYERYHLIATSMDVCLFDWNYETGEGYSSKNFSQYLLGRENPEDIFSGRIPDEAIHPDDRLILRTSLISQFSDGKPYCETTLRLKRAAGGYDWCRLTVSCLRDKDKAIKRFIGILVKVDAMREDASAGPDALSPPLPDGFLLFEAGEQITVFYASPGLCRSMGYDASTCPRDGRTLFALIHPGDRMRFEQKLRLAAASDDPIGMDLRISSADRPAEYGIRQVRALRIPYGAGEKPVLLALVTDITELAQCVRNLRADTFKLRSLTDM